MELSNDQMVKVLNFLHGKKCPFCGGNYYSAPQTVEIPVACSGLPNRLIKEAIYCYCSECGHVALFDAFLAGIS